MKTLLLNAFRFNKIRHDIIYTKLLTNDNYLQNLNSKNVGLFFGSIKGTLNHIFLADLMMYMRLAGLNDTITIKSSFNTELTFSLVDLYPLWQKEENATAFEDFIGKHLDNSAWGILMKNMQLELVEHKYIKLLTDLTEDELGKEFYYIDTSGNAKGKLRYNYLFHVVNHSSHHLGQLSNALYVFDKSDYPNLDYNFYI